MRHPARRIGQSFVAITAAALVSLSGAGVANAALPPAELQRVTDQYLFTDSITTFISTRDQAPYADQLDWSSDSCSWSPDSPLGFNFDPSCKRHDFGYRNYKRQARFNEDTRLRIDDNFRSDLYNECDGNWVCNGAADIYYNAVREFGASSTSTADALTQAGTEDTLRAFAETAESLEQAGTQGEADRLLTAFEQGNDVEIRQDYPVNG
ncbi:phospholipase [Nocardiopsis sediminis]|uniref:Phospholipase n=1 Tax=Nocardiopsis sediminis TaxID=1778267 RepID=A0ABV8FTV5_9ACTN